MGRAASGGDRPNTPSHWPLSQEPIRVGLIENHRLLRERLADLMKRQPGLHVVASMDATPGGLERLQAARPQVVVIGANVSEAVCYDCVRGVRQGLPEARVVVLNVSATQEEVILLIETGASGLLLQSATVDELLRTIRLVARGMPVVPDPLVPLLFAHLRDQGLDGPVAAGNDLNDPLTRREREIGLLIAGGLSNQAIADRLEISLHTVKTHVSSILGKLDLRSRLQLAAHFNRAPRLPAGGRLTGGDAPAATAVGPEQGAGERQAPDNGRGGHHDYPPPSVVRGTWRGGGRRERQLQADPR